MQTVNKIIPNIHLGNLILGLGLVIYFDIFFMDDAKEYFGLLTHDRHVYIVTATSHVAACHGKKGKIVSVYLIAPSTITSSVFAGRHNFFGK